jgi:hypothetical protein
MYSFLIVTVTNDHKVTLQANQKNVITLYNYCMLIKMLHYFPIVQEVRNLKLVSLGLTPYEQTYVLSENSKTELIYLSFPISRDYMHSLAHGPIPPFSKPVSLIQVFLILPPF